MLAVALLLLLVLVELSRTPSPLHLAYPVVRLVV